MAYASLADFLEDMEGTRGLLRVEAEVDPDLEIAEVARRTAAQGGPALLFSRVRGQRLPLLVNLLHDEARVCRALGTATLDEASARLAEQLRPAAPLGWLDAVRMLPGSDKSLPRVVRSGACQQVVRLASDVDLAQLPLLRCWPDDAGPGIAAAPLLTQSPEDGWRNLELASAQVLERNRLALQWSLHGGAQRALAECRRRGERLSVALVLGGHPLDLLTALAPLGHAADPWSLAGVLRGKAVDLVKGRTIDVDVPADAEIIIEGTIDPAAPPVAVPQGATFTGYYRLPATSPVVQVTAITHRANPVCMAIVPGAPSHELGTLRRAVAKLFRPQFCQLVDGLVDYDFPAAAGGQQVTYVSIRKTCAHQARRVAGALWALEPWMFAKLMVLVDEHVNVHDAGEVLRHMGANVHPGRDTFFQQGPADADDHACPTPLAGHLLGIDATAKLPSEHPRQWPAAAAMNQTIQDLVAARWAEYGL